MMFSKLNKKRLGLLALSVAVGSLGGYAYYYFIGCSSGSCAITSNPLHSTLYGALLGWLAGDMLPNNKTKNEENA